MQALSDHDWHCESKFITLHHITPVGAITKTVSPCDLGYIAIKLVPACGQSINDRNSNYSEVKKESQALRYMLKCGCRSHMLFCNNLIVIQKNVSRIKYNCRISKLSKLQTLNSLNEQFYCLVLGLPTQRHLLCRTTSLRCCSNCSKCTRNGQGIYGKVPILCALNLYCDEW